METRIIVCFILSMVALGVLTILLVRALAKVNQTARKAELFANTLNEKLAKKQAGEDAKADVAEIFSNGAGKVISSAFGLLNNFLKKRKSFSEESSERGKSYSAPQRNKEEVLKDVSDKSGEKLAVFLLGGLVGAGAAFLFAPRTGKEVRRLLRNWIKDFEGKSHSPLDEGGEILRKSKEAEQEKA